jgi:hypothetical protein
MQQLWAESLEHQQASLGRSRAAGRATEARRAGATRHRLPRLAVAHRALGDLPAAVRSTSRRWNQGAPAAADPGTRALTDLAESLVSSPGCRRPPAAARGLDGLRRALPPRAGATDQTTCAGAMTLPPPDALRHHPRGERRPRGGTRRPARGAHDPESIAAQAPELSASNPALPACISRSAPCSPRHRAGGRPASGAGRRRVRPLRAGRAHRFETVDWAAPRRRRGACALATGVAGPRPRRSALEDRAPS